MRRVLVLVIGVSVLAFGCGDDDDDDTGTTSAPDSSAAATTAETEAPTTTVTEESEAASTEAPTTGVPATEPPATEDAVAGTADCLTGTFDVVDITPIAGGDADLPITIQGAVTGLTLSFDGLAWELVADGAQLTAEAAGVSATLTLDGSAAGQFVATGDQVAFEIEAADGTATAQAGGVSQDLEFADVITALNPTGMARMACGDDAATLVTDSVEMKLTPVA
jgi:hypothetical protein